MRHVRGIRFSVARVYTKVIDRFRFGGDSRRVTRILGSAQSFSRPLAGGEAGTAQTIHAMFQLVDDAVKDATLHRHAIDILRECPQYNPTAEARCIYDFVLMNFQYRQDPIGPLGAKEMLIPPAQMLAIRAGDCDDLSMLMAALLGSVGIETHFVTVAADPNSPEDFSHVYAEALLDGRWISVDVARPDAAFGLSPQHYFRKKVWNPDGSSQNANGVGRVHSLNGYTRMGAHRRIPWRPENMRGGVRGLGDDSTTAQNIQAVGTSIADIELAANPAPGTVYANLTPGTSGGAAPLLPYGANYNYAAGAPASFDFAHHAFAFRYWIFRVDLDGETLMAYAKVSTKYTTGRSAVYNTPRMAGYQDPRFRCGAWTGGSAAASRDESGNFGTHGRDQHRPDQFAIAAHHQRSDSCAESE